MIEKESSQNIGSGGAGDAEDLDDILLNFDETSGEGLPSDEKLAEMARKAPEPLALGNEQVEVLSHNLILRSGKTSQSKGVSVEYKNKAGAVIGRLSLEAVLFDAKGYAIETVKKAINDFEPGRTRMIHFNSSSEKADVKSYEVKISGMVLTPAAEAAGDDRIAVLKHGLHDSTIPETEEVKKEIEIAVKNIHNETIATAVFSAEVFDCEGNFLGAVRHVESDIKPDASRAVTIQINSILKHNSARSYKVNVIKSVTADIQKVLLRRDERRMLPNGDINISGVVKNVYSIKTDAAVSAAFINANKVELGTVVLPVKNIEPGATKPFSLIFRPPAGEAVKTYVIDIGETAEAIA